MKVPVELLDYNLSSARPSQRAIWVWGFSCAVTVDDGSVLGCADNRHGALGYGSTDRPLTPVRGVNP
jgi:hypothetical protein